MEMWTAFLECKTCFHRFDMEIPHGKRLLAHKVQVFGYGAGMLLPANPKHIGVRIEGEDNSLMCPNCINFNLRQTKEIG